MSGVSGALSSQARIARITVSDAQGPWLQIENAEVDWNRLALLRGRVDVNQLSAARIDWLRRPETPETGRKLPSAEATPFALPELPVAINLRALSVDTMAFAEPVFGQAAELSMTGSLNLVGGVLDTSLDVKRLDAPGAPSTSPRRSPTSRASSTSTWHCASRAAAWSRRCSTSKAGRRST